MGGIQQVPSSDFSGGFTPKLASTDFSDRQWAKLEGVVLEDEAEIRSQWACQQIGTLDNVAWVVPYQGYSRLYLIALSLDLSGSIWYCEVPPATAASATTEATTWKSLTGPTYGAQPEDRYPIGLVPLKAASSEGYRSALLVTPGPGPDPDSGGTTTAALAIHQADGSTDLTFVEWTNQYPALEADGETPTSNVMPRARFGTMWEDYLVLGSIEWYVDGASALSDSNVKPYRNGLWFSQGGDPTAFDPQSVVFVGDPETNITGMSIIDAGLVVFTSSGPFDTGGAFLLRGRPDYFEPERLSAIGADQGACTWAYTGAAAWISETGEVFHSNGEEVMRLDDPLDLDRTSHTSDNLQGFGPYLIASRLGRLFAFRVFETDGAWTELIVPPNLGGIRSMRAVADQLVFIAASNSGWGTVWRYVRREHDERGQLGGVPIEPTISTRTVEAGGGHDVTFWHRFGFRATGPGRVETITLRGGPALDDEQPTLVHTLARPLEVRDELVVPAHGPSVEASAEVVFSGDVRVEQTSWWAHRGRGSR